jgi:MFS family permease
LVAFVARSARHPAPVIELALLRVRSFAMASLAGLLFTAAFAAMLLSNVLFLTEVWRWSVLHAGLALAPGPLCAALASPAAGALAARVGQRWVAAAGALLFAASSALTALGMEERAVYASVLLPAMAIGGIGIGTALATLASAASASLPAARLATGTGAFVMLRQVGGVVGVAALVALLGEPGPHEALAAFREGWWFQAVTAAAAAVAALAIGRVDGLASATPGSRATVDAPSAAALGARE